MAQYIWQHIDSPERLKLFSLTEPLATRALALLADGNEIELGEMWYGNRLHYQVRHTPRVDYDMTESDRAELHIERNGHRYWVMGHGGSVHSTPFITLDAAERYMRSRLEGAPA